MNVNNTRRRYAIGHKDGNKVNNRVDNLEWVGLPIDVADGNCYTDGKRTVKTINEYEEEAYDKVWLTRTHPDENPNVETARLNNIERILSTYPDIPENGYSEWECGYWNGIMSALRWMKGEDKDFLDT